MIARERRQWFAVGAVIAALAIGGWALMRFAPAPEAPQIGRRAPDYRVTRLGSGDTVALRTSNAGHVTLINVWATWCGPCRKEMPSMQRAYQVYRDRGFRIAAVSVDDGDAAGVKQFVQEMGLTFEILLDPRSGILERYQTVGVPESFLLDRNGRIAYIALGAEEWDSPENRARIEKLLPGND